MFSRRDDEQRPDALRIVRDVVEIVAILAAGAWAFYTFVYETRVVPALAQPKINFEASIERVSDHGGLIGIRVVRKIQNVGLAPTHFIGIATQVYGERVHALTQPNRGAIDAASVFIPAYYQLSRREAVYTSGFITRLGDPATRSDLALDAGESQENEVILYVPRGKFDRLSVFLLARYTRYDDKPIPTAFHLTPQGSLEFKDPHDDRVYEFSTIVSSLDLNG